jgi:CubicO group peptidase (beta-lactamase class C family)
MKYFVFIVIAFLFSSCLAGRFAWYNFSNITDYKIFPSRKLPASSTPFRFITSEFTKPIRNINIAKWDSLVGAAQSVAFIIIRNDSILFEKYYNNYEASSTVASFSMAKSYTSALIGAAISDGHIKSVDDKITDYLPELASRKGFDKIMIKHLLQMTSGIKANESYYNPFGQAAVLYYGRTLRRYLAHLKTDYEPGTQFAYRSVNTQLLGLIIERATKKNVTDYLNEKIWAPMQPEFEASWSIDKKKNGLEKTFCCINAKARDFAKLGRLYLNNGNWNGQQLLPKQWIVDSTTPETINGGVNYYKYQWWIARSGFFADGLHGQYIFVNPKKNLIIVRLGKGGGHTDWWSKLNELSEKI